MHNAEIIVALNNLLYAAITPVNAGRVAVLVDISGSMHCSLSSKGKTLRCTAAASLAAIARERYNADLYLFNDNVHAVSPQFRGADLVQNIVKANSGGTLLYGAMERVALEHQYDRMIVITDEQANDVYTPGKVKLPKEVVVLNVSTEKNSIVRKNWLGLTGFSANMFDFIDQEFSK
jgi:hypothetical protein